MPKKKTDFECLDIQATQSDFARLVGVSQPTVNKHVKSGLLAEGESLKIWLLAYTGRLREEASGRGGEETDPLRAATIREKNARAKKIELQILEEEGRLVDREYLFVTLGPIFSHIKQTLEASGRRLASEMSHRYGVSIDKSMIDKEHREALTLIADISPEEFEPKDREALI